MESQKSITLKGTKRLFLKLGSCSRTLGYILDREFGHLMEAEERALDPLSGGILQQGYQCGMLWGCALASGAEAYRRSENQGKAIALAIKATQQIMDSFKKRAKHIDCDDIANCNWSSKRSVAKYFVSGKVVSCYKLLGNWAPEAVQAAYDGLSHEKAELPEHCMSCASEVIKKMGGSDEEILMVAGFAGGMGLSGNACGALAAAIWMETLTLCKKQPGKSFYFSPETQKLLGKFYHATDYEILCSEITGKQFNTLDDHTGFIEEGGCEKLINVLADNKTDQ